MLDGAGAIALRRQHASGVEVREGEIGMHPEKFEVLLQSAGPVALAFEEAALQAARLGRFRVELYRLVDLLAGVGNATHGGQRDGVVGTHLCIAGLELDRAREGGDGGGKIAAGGEQMSESAEGVGEIRIDGQGEREFLFGGVEIAGAGGAAASRLWASAMSGSSAVALRYAAMASASWPSAVCVMPSW